MTRVVVVSPHLDDGVFSLGSTIARLASEDTSVELLTVLAGDPESRVPAGWWDRKTGFRVEGEAASARREEDSRACRLLGATPVWLPFSDAQYGGPDDYERVWSEVAAAVAGSDSVLLPGFPLHNADHAWLSRLLLERGLPTARVGLYVEQPYAWRAWQHGREKPSPLDATRPLLDKPVTWQRQRTAWCDRLAKVRASRAYASQLQMLGRLPLERVALHEALHGGEALAWI